jgi:flagellar hook-associated protein FlgK
MADMLSISSTAVAAYQRALSTVSNNIANVSTDGYSRQDVALQSNTPAKAANSFLGTGVMFTAVKRQYDEFAESNLRKSTSDLMSQDPLVNYSQRVMDLMGDKSVGLSSALDQFFSSASSLAAVTSPHSFCLPAMVALGSPGTLSAVSPCSICSQNHLRP